MVFPTMIRICSCPVGDSWVWVDHELTPKKESRGGPEVES